MLGNRLLYSGKLFLTNKKSIFPTTMTRLLTSEKMERNTTLTHLNHLPYLSPKMCSSKAYFSSCISLF